MSTIIQKPIKITIPVHDEMSGWVKVASPEEPPVKLRLEQTTVTKTPKDLHRAELNAEKLRVFHLEAIKQRAARENQRVQESKSRRLRNEANARSKLQARLNTVKSREDRLTEEKIRSALERKEARVALADAVKACRIDRVASIEQRAANEAARCFDASRKRNMAIQATVEKNSFAVKHALAVAVAAKEKECDQASQMSDRLSARLFAAESRRQPIAPDQSTPRTVERSQRHVRSMHALSMEREQKHVEAITREEAAHNRRRSALQIVKARAEAVVNKTKQVSPPPSPTDTGVRRALFGKLNQAEMRRLSLPRFCGPVRAPIMIEVQMHSRPETAPAALVERLSSKLPPGGFALGCLSVVRVEHAAGTDPLNSQRPSSQERHDRAAARRFMYIMSVSAMGALFGRLRPLAALAARSAVRAARAKAFNTRTDAASRALVSARATRTASAKKMNARVGEADTRRAVVRAARLCTLRRRALQKDAAAGRRAGRLLSRSVKVERHVLASMRRATVQLGRFMHGELSDTTMRLADANRAQTIGQIVAKAKLASMRRSIPVKLSQRGDCVQVVVSACVKVAVSEQGASVKVAAAE